MKYHKIVLAGGNGYLGTVLAAYYKNIADEVIILSRHPKSAGGNIKTLVWDAKHEGDWIAQLENADLLMNLCGKSVNCRYTKKNKQEILASRIDPTAFLNRVVLQLQSPPKLWINASSATIYRHAEDRPQDELNGELGYGFSVDICRAWENEFFKTNTPHIRKIALRIGIVFGKNSAVFPPLLNLVRYGLGGQQGNGKQYVSWIHEEDIAGITEWLLEHHEMSGIINATAPNPVTNAEQMKLIRDIYGRSIGVPAPAWLLNIGAIIIGTEPGREHTRQIRSIHLY
jgi:uncharacterized protein (TIGR01777 family)